MLQLIIYDAAVSVYVSHRIWFTSTVRNNQKQTQKTEHIWLSAEWSSKISSRMLFLSQDGREWAEGIARNDEYWDGTSDVLQ